MTPPPETPTIDSNPADLAVTRTAAGAPVPPPAPADFATPGYQILGELGRGGMGVVYKAKQVALDRQVALKVVLGAAHAGADQLARFRAEATAAARLSHPNIVQVFEVGEHLGSPFFSLELVEGGTLADRLRGEPQPPRAAAELVRTLARAVEHAHSRGIVHRDLKPANVLLSGVRGQESGVSKATGLTPDSWLLTPKVADLGLAKQQAADSHLTQTGAILGTPSYMAPEQAAGDTAAVGPPADVYALGAILYECLTGRPPFKAATVVDTVYQVRHDEPVPPSRLQPKLPRDLETVCLKCLAKKPEQRYPSAAELADDLDRFLAGQSVRARPTSTVVKGWKWARRHPAAAVVLFLLAVPLPALLGVMVFLWTEARQAKRAADADRQAAIEARDQADRERDLSQQYLHGALGVMEKVVDRVADGPLSRVPQAQEDRAAILDDAVTFYESLLRLDSTDPAVRFETAQAYQRVARLSTVSGRIDKAEAASRSAIDLLTELVTEYPDRPQFRNELARSQMFLAHARLLNADNDRAGDAYRQALETIAPLLAEFPADPDYQTTAADAHRSLGYFLMVTNPPEADRHFVEAVRLAEAVRAARPDDASRALLASALGARGQAQVVALQGPKPGKPKDIEAILDRAAALLDPKAGPPPPGGHARLNFDEAQLTTRFGLAALYAMTGRAARGEELCRQAIREYEGLIVAQPKAFPYRMQAIQAYRLLGRLSSAARRPADSAKALGRALELMDGVVRDYPAFVDAAKGGWLRDQRQAVLANHASQSLAAGATADAARSASEIDLARPAFAGNGAYHVACVFARLAATADGSLRDEYAAKTMTLLKHAAATGYPATPADVEHVVSKDDDLKPLRDRPEFKEWAKTLVPTKGK